MEKDILEYIANDTSYKHNKSESDSDSDYIDSNSDNNDDNDSDDNSNNNATDSSNNVSVQKKGKKERNISALLTIDIFITRRIYHYLNVYKNTNFNCTSLNTCHLDKHINNDIVNTCKLSHILLCQSPKDWFRLDSVKIYTVNCPLCFNKKFNSNNDIFLAKRAIDTCIEFREEKLCVYTTVYGCIYIYYLSLLSNPYILNYIENKHQQSTCYRELYMNLSKIMYKLSSTIDAYYKKYNNTNFYRYFLDTDIDQPTLCDCLL